MSDFIYLASSSQSRQALLRLANIPYVVIKQGADESKFNRQDSLQNVVSGIAVEKMHY